MIYVYIGIMGSGKDFNSRTQSAKSKAKAKIKVAFADAVRDICWTGLNWRPENEEQYMAFKENTKIAVVQDGKIINEISGRAYMQKLGTDAIRRYNDEFWVDIVETKIKDILTKEPDTDIFITDCRFENELKMLLRFEDVKIIFCDYKSSSYAISDHESEAMANHFRILGFQDLEDITNKVKTMK